jgi:epoxide hydrolase-like predicted phosphatase
MIRAIIFDCFGVIIGDALEVLCRDLRTRNPQAADDIRSLVQASNRGITDPSQTSHQIAELIGLTYQEYRQKLTAGEIRDEAVLAYIMDLRKTYKTALLSNIGAGSLARRFQPGELETYFDSVVASGEIGYAKPEARAYQITAERLGVEPRECLFTDDREPYCNGAAQVGMQTILYQNFPQFRADLEKLLADSE